MAKRPIEITVDTRRLNEVAKMLPTELDAAGRKAAADMSADIILSFGTSPGGKKYPRGKRYHIASKPGYPPNVDTGALRASIGWQGVGRLRWMIYAGTEYADILEFGSKKTAPRPFMTPVFNEWARTKLIDLLRREGLFDG